MKINHRFTYYCHICDQILTSAHAYHSYFYTNEYWNAMKKIWQDQFALEIYYHIKEHGRIKERADIDFYE